MMILAEAVTPETLQVELDQAEKDFQTAQQMFSPWYAGPLIAGSAHMIPPGFGNIQPYLFAIDNYGTYNGDRHQVGLAHHKWQLNVPFVIQAGITSWADTSLIPQAFLNWQEGRSSGGWGDTKWQFGLKILAESMYVPAIKFVVAETFPCGEYRNLGANKASIEALGAGSYQTTFGLNFGKVVFWNLTHPMQLRLNVAYTIPSNVHVKGFNAYGGGIGTRGHVSVGNSFLFDFSTELSLTQNWVFANDIVYTYQDSTSFSGQPGLLPNGTIATNGGPSNDQLSLAPAIEYNWNSNLGVLLGTQFSVYGRNSSAFASAILTVTYFFPF